MVDVTRFEPLEDADHDLSPDECAALAGAAAGLVDLDALERTGEGSFELLWRTQHSEAWLNLWWEPRDTGFHDHSGSCVGVHVLEGTARNEALVMGGERRVREYGAGESFSFPGSGIHRMEHDRGAVTIHVYSPPISAIGHYDVVDGELRRESGPPDQGSPPSPALSAALDGPTTAAAAKRTPLGIFARPESARADSGLAQGGQTAEASSSAYVIEIRPRAPVTPSS